MWNTVTGQALKFGISSGKVSAAGQSYRITRQIRELAARGIKADGAIIADFRKRATAINWEKAAVIKAKKYGWSLPEQHRP